MDTLLNLTHTLERYMARIVVKKVYQKDMCHDEIELGMCSKYIHHSKFNS